MWDLLGLLQQIRSLHGRALTRLCSSRSISPADSQPRRGHRVGSGTRLRAPVASSPYKFWLDKCNPRECPYKIKVLNGIQSTTRYEYTLCRMFIVCNSEQFLAKEFCCVTILPSWCVLTQERIQCQCVLVIGGLRHSYSWLFHLFSFSLFFRFSFSFLWGQND